MLTPPPAGADRGGEIPVGEEARDRGGEAAGIARLDEQALDLGLDQVGNAADPGRDDRKRRLHVLEDRERRPLEVRAADRDVEGAEEVGDVVALPEQHHGAAEAELGDPLLEPGSLGPLADDQDPERRQIAGQLRRGLDQHVESLLRAQRADGADDRDVRHRSPARP